MNGWMKLNEELKNKTAVDPQGFTCLSAGQASHCWEPSLLKVGLFQRQYFREEPPLTVWGGTSQWLELRINTGKIKLSPRPQRASLVAQLVKNPLAMQETWVRSLSWEDPLEKGTAAHSSILAWRIPWHNSLVGYREYPTSGEERGGLGAGMTQQALSGHKF